jgi:hypothetical protein
MSMPVLPDCTVCGGPVVLVVDGSAWEVCVRCGNAQRPIPPKVDRLEVRAQAREVVRRARREGLPRLRCPSCKRGRHDHCHAVTCECTENDHPRRPDAPA